MEDIVLNKCRYYLDSDIMELLKDHELEQEIKLELDPLIVYIVTDIMVHFILTPLVNVEGYERWKQNMGLHDYCVGAIKEIDDGMNWDINWLVSLYGTENEDEFKAIYRNIYNSFLELC